MKRLIQPVIVPTSLLECAGTPPKPADLSDVEIAIALVRLDAAHRDCKDSLGEVRALLAAQGVTG